MKQFAFPLAQNALHLPVDLSMTMIVPCYNEENRLNFAIFADFIHENYSIKWIFVNDGSTDNTLKKLQEFSEHFPQQVTILNLPQNQGKAEAVRQGLLAAQKTSSTLIGYWDADLATPLDAIYDFQQIFQKSDEIALVMGARRKMLGHKVERSLKRRFISKSCALLGRVALALPISDTQCGAKIFRNSPSLHAALREKFRAGWLFDVELIGRMIEADPKISQKIYEYPLFQWTEIAGSKIGTKAIIQSGLIMFSLIARRVFRVFQKNTSRKATINKEQLC